MKYDDFYNNLLPGNYALTKSMELTKIKTSGTLWYIKKFLVLYYYIFLTDDIYTKAYVNAITNEFNNYIDSLPDTIKKDAEIFFFSDNEYTDFRSSQFKTFTSFTNFTLFNNIKERDAYDRNARKYYFALLMGTGGQTGVKKILKKHIQHPDFIYNDKNIHQAIFDAAINVCVDQINTSHKINDNSVHYIISDKALNEIVKLSNYKEIFEDDVKKICEKYPNNNPNYKTIVNDIVAFIRNERQVLFYYGYFHSKSSGANDMEFSSMTPVGYAALHSNAEEFLVLWEHQKLKMISQPVTVDINDVPIGLKDANNFSLSFNPYIDILECILEKDYLTEEEYKYIISRKNNKIMKCWNEIKDDVFNNIEEIKYKINNFGRIRDKKHEDFHKEILKYLLGVRSDIPLDKNTNILNLIEYNKGNYKCINKKALNNLLILYKKLTNYKLAKYESIFVSCENDLKKRYVSSTNGISSCINPKIKILWDLYNINMDKFITLSLLFYFSSLALDLNLLETSREDQNKIAIFALDHYTSLLKSFSLNTTNKVKNIVYDVIKCLNTNDFSEYINVNDEIVTDNITIYKEMSTNDLFNKIINISRISDKDGERKRNTALISLLKSYYLNRFANDGFLKCECCGSETFITDSGQPYVEFHHLIPFNLALGPDHYLNLYALCPNCHRKIHFLSINDKEKEYENINDNNYLNKSIVERLQELKKEKILCSYHLEFLLAEHAINQVQYDMIVN